MRNYSIFSLLTLCLICIVAPATAQTHICGTSHEVQDAMRPYPNVVSPRNNSIYLPIRFHLAANAKGEGLPSFARVLDQLDRVNKDFAASNVQFYLQGPNFYNIIKDDTVNEAPRDNGSYVASFKDRGAINVFVTKSTFDDGRAGTILGYFTGLGLDHVVMLNSQLASSNNTLSHELGHFFNLPHTFFGWEAEPYDASKHGSQVILKNAPTTSVAVELVNKSNCDVAADRICDTSPDYNFGYGANSCVFNRDVLDANGEQVKPLIDNQMGYFLLCSKYSFTPNQNTRMSNSIYSTSRDYIRSTYQPKTDIITASPTITSPVATAPTYNNVLVTWNAVAGATHYFVEFNDGRNSISRIVNTNSLRMTELLANTNYFVRVRAFNEYYTGTNTVLSLFKTGTVLSSVGEEELDKFNVEALTNPIAKGQNINLAITSPSAGDAVVRVFDQQGKIVTSKTVSLVSGDQQISIDTELMSTGIHYVRIESKMGTQSKKILILQ